MASLSIGRCAAVASSSVRRSVQDAACRSSQRGFSALLTATEQYPDLPDVTPTPSQAGITSSTTLDCGLTVATETSASTSTVSLTFPNGGSSSETASETGAALANKCLAFKSAGGMSSMALLRALEDCGATVFTTATRYGAGVGYTASPEVAGELVGGVLAAVDSSFEKWDVKEAVGMAKVHAAEAATKAELVLTEQMYAAAYGPQSPLGRPFFSPSVSASGLISFRQRTYALDGAVLVATGVADHDSFVAEVLDALEDLPVPAKSTGEVAKATDGYMGGESRVHSPGSGSAYIALAGKGPSGSSALTNVIKHGLALSSGASAFAAPGLIGLCGTAPAAEGGALTDSLAAALSKSISSDVLKRAKMLAKAEAIFALEAGSAGLAEGMAASVLETGGFSVSDVSKAYDAVTEKDVSAALKDMAASKKSLAAVGEIDAVPYLGSL